MVTEKVVRMACMLEKSLYRCEMAKLVVAQQRLAWVRQPLVRIMVFFDTVMRHTKTLHLFQGI